MSILLKLSFLSVLALAASAHFGGAQAQATRTWVSGTGDDVNPCSRTAPCKTFAGAISKTAAKGEINCLDPGGFGGVTITKAIIISCEGVTGGVLVSGTNAIVVNAAATDVVVLRGLDINGLGPSLNGIKFIAGGALHVQDCQIRGFSATSTGNGNGILIKPEVASSANVILDGVRVENNLNGILADGFTTTGNVTLSIRNSAIDSNAASGLIGRSGSGVTSIIAEGSQFQNNGARGVFSNRAGSIIRLGNSTVSGNGVGLSVQNGGELISLGGNLVAGNATDGAFTGTIAQQ